MVSNFGFGGQQVPCYLSEFLAFKCYFCHAFVMCYFYTWMKLSAECWTCNTANMYRVEGSTLFQLPVG